MSSRALSLATVVLLIGFGAADAVLAQATNLEAGKAPSQLFAQTCSACHKSPRGLLKTVAPGSLPGFLRQHYTTSSDMAGVLASYLVSNGATDTRYQAKDGKDKKDGAKDKEASTNPAQSPEHQGRRQRSQEAAKPEGETAAPAAEGARQKRAARPSEEGVKEGAKPEGQATPEGRKAKRLSKRGKPETEEAPKVDAAAPAADDRKSEPKPDTAKVEPGRDEAKPDSAKASEKPAEPKPESARVEPRGSEAPALRPDPVPQVTPAPPAAATKPAEPAAPKA
ncbi:c-type cytochrome, partial [Bradyrhizobium diazoefficiens]